jgi:hypothetical protein
VDVAFAVDGIEKNIYTSATPPAAVSPGAYRFAIQVTADDAEVANIYLLVRWDGRGWDSLSAVEASPGTWVD